MHIAILDDEAVFREQIKTIITSQFPTYSISSFATASEILECKIDFDLLLLDVDMPDMDGISFSKKYHSQFSKIIFITSYSEYVYDAFGKNIYGFIKKEDLQIKLIEKLTEVMKNEDNKIVVNTELGECIINESHILYFFSANGIVHLKTKKEIVVLNNRSLKKLYDNLNLRCFQFANRNILVNVKKIDSISKHSKTIELINEEKLKVSRRNWQPLLDKYHEEAIT